MKKTILRRDIIEGEAVGKEPTVAKETIVIIAAKEIEALAQITQEIAQKIGDREVEEFIISRMVRTRAIDERFDLQLLFDLNNLTLG